MKINAQTILCSFICLLVSNHIFSQSRFIYNLPNTAHASKLQNKGDLVFSIGGFKHYDDDFEFIFIGSGGVNRNQFKYVKNTTNLQLAYSPIKRLSISFNHGRIVTKNQSNRTEKYHKSHNLGISVGTYFPIKFRQRIILQKEKKGTPQYRNLLIDFHLGYTRGSIMNQYSLGFVDLKLRKHAIQGGLHYLGKFMDFSYLLKFGQVNYIKGLLNGKTDFPSEQSLALITSESNFVFWENSFRMELKFRRSGLFSQITTTTNWEFGNGQIRTNIVHVGIAIRFKNIVLKKSVNKD